MAISNKQKPSAALYFFALIVIGVFTVTSWPDGQSARAQDISDDMQCLRYLQSYERSINIPRGLLIAIAFVESGRSIGQGRSAPWPWTINAGGTGQFFDTKAEAVAEAQRLLDAGQRSIDVGCMQINLRYHPNAFRNLEDAFNPARNVAYGAQFLRSLHRLQGSWRKAVERYHSSDDGRREQYRDRVLARWNQDARSIVMNAALAEDTDTPYHRAIKDYAAGRYAEALDKYQAIVDTLPTDRTALLGLAMSYEMLERDDEAHLAYAQYLAREPSNQSVLSHVLRQSLNQPHDQARADLTELANAGVKSAEVMAALSEVSAALGDDEAALEYASNAIQSAPDVTLYYLNAGVLADRLNRAAAAVAFYEQFLNRYSAEVVFVDTSIDGIRNRLKYLRDRL